MSYRKIIQEAWVFTQQHKRLIFWYGFIPSIFTTGAGILYIAYQVFAFRQSPLFSNADTSFLFNAARFIIEFLSNHLSISVPLIIASIILIIVYLLFPTLAEAAAIQYIARQRNGQNVSLGTGMKYGLFRFLPLFEYHLLIKTFGLFTILIEIGFVLRNLGIAVFKLLLPLFIIIATIGLILALLFTYTAFFIVIDEEEIFPSIRKSVKLVILHWQETFFITILMIIIGIRIILQVLLLLLVPALILFMFALFAALKLATLGIVIGIIFGLFALFFASYLGGVVNIFSNTVWTFTFLKLTSQEEQSAREQV